ncbi:MAG TPA: hypothetical protein PKA58_19695, partial [Polyangium sp.]|nr:hypothetical protein [Polyangium sp.]
MNRSRFSRVRSMFCGVALMAGIAAGSTSAWAVDKDQALTTASQQIRLAVSDMQGIDETIARSRTGQRSASQMVGDAVLLMASRDWDRAATVLSKVI